MVAPRSASRWLRDPGTDLDGIRRGTSHREFEVVRRKPEASARTEGGAGRWNDSREVGDGRQREPDREHDSRELPGQSDGQSEHRVEEEFVRETPGHANDRVVNRIEQQEGPDQSYEIDRGRHTEVDRQQDGRHDPEHRINANETPNQVWPETIGMADFMAVGPHDDKSAHDEEEIDASVAEDKDARGKIVMQIEFGDAGRMEQHDQERGDAAPRLDDV